MIVFSVPCRLILTWHIHSAKKKSLSLMLRNLWEMLALFVRFFIVPWLDTLQRYKTIFESTNFSLKKTILRLK